MTDSLFTLNEAQRAAVLHDRGPILVIAGAGTGKTRVITSRIAHLIESGKARPEEILALTFTDKAAGEMQARVDEILPLGYQELQISTFHAFGQLLLQEYGLEIGLSTDFSLLTKAKQWLLVQQHLFELPLNYYRPLGNPLKFIDALLTHIERAKQELLSPAAYLEFVQTQATAAGLSSEDLIPSNTKAPSAEVEEIQKRWEIAQLYVAYQQLLVADPKQTRLDFGDLIYLSVLLLRRRESVRQQVQQRFRYILVDEFQDTNYSQNELVKLILGPEQNLMVVGDDDQSIYRFRGAAVSNILGFQTDFPEAKTLVLTHNYRSSQAILDTAYGVIQNNNPDRLEVKAEIDKKLRGHQGEGEVPTVLRGMTSDDEAELVVARILAIKEENSDLQWSDFAILARANAHLEPFVQVLRYRGIPFTVAGSRGLYTRPEIKDLLAFLYVLVNPDDSTQLFRLMSIEVLGIPPIAVLQIFQTARRKNLTLWQMLHALEVVDELDVKAIEAVSKLVGLLEEKRESGAYGNAGELLLEFLKDIGYTKALLEEDSLESANKILNIRKLFDLIKLFLREDDNPTVLGYISYVEVMIEAGDDPATAEMDAETDAVRLMTIHAAKGLEFDSVFLVNMVSQRFPTRRRSEALPLPEIFIQEILPEGDEHLEEERRLFYVGMTRAKRNLFLTYADDYGGVRTRKPSPFIEEAMGAAPAVGAAVRVEVKPPREAGLEREQSFDVQAHLPRQFSYSQLQTFEQCPLRYKYSHIYRVPVQLERSLVFGQVIHHTLKDFYESLREKAPSLPHLLALYQSHWTREGFASSAEVEAQHARGVAMLKRFWTDNEGTLSPAHALEQEFHWRFGNGTLKGYIDRIDRLEDGTYEIIDYKTGAIADQETLDKRAVKDEQLSIYALAARDVLKLDVSRFTLYFLESGKQGTATRSPKQLDKVAAEIEATTAQIHQSDFKATPSPFVCKLCPYQQICPFAL